jgi:hypothetical protein
MVVYYNFTSSIFASIIIRVGRRAWLVNNSGK